MKVITRLQRIVCLDKMKETDNTNQGINLTSQFCTLYDIQYFYNEKSH